MAGVVAYTDDYKPDFGLPWPRRYQTPEESYAGWSDDEVREELRIKLLMEQNALQDVIQFGWTLEGWREVCEEWKNYTTHVICGGNRCVHGDTPIYDPKEGVTRPINSISGTHHVYAFDGAQLHVAEAETPFIKGTEQMVKIILKDDWTMNGGRGETSFVCTPAHRILGPNQSFVSVGDLKVGDKVFNLGSRWDTIQRWTVVGMAVAGLHNVWDMTVPKFGNYLAAGVIHHNSSKSVFCARLMVHLLQIIPEAKIRCYHVNEAASVNEQQSLIWDALPARYKVFSRKRGPVAAIQYSQKNGFAGGKLILPALPGYRRGAEMIFGNYQQYRNDPQVVEGWWAHAVWGDEEMPLKMYERLLTRLYDSHGRLVLSFTTIQGWSPLVAEFLASAKTIRTRFADLLGRKIPVAQESKRRKSTRIHYYWTQDNPFIPEDAIGAMKGRPETEILSVAYGIPTKAAVSKFPLFDETVHVIKHEDLPWIKVAEGKNPPEVTRYMVIDPSGSKPWFIAWLAFDAMGRIFIYDEYPDIGYGAWGELGESSEGKPGPGCKPNGWGYGNYCEMIKGKESEDEIFERYIDPRLSASVRASEDGATTLGSELEDAFQENSIEPNTVLAAPGLKVEHGISLINDRLNYDPRKPIDLMNSPKLYISDRCQNVIEAFKNYSGCSTDEIWKDPIDTVRYALEAGCCFVAKSEMAGEGQTFSY